MRSFLLATLVIVVLYSISFMQPIQSRQQRAVVESKGRRADFPTGPGARLYRGYFEYSSTDDRPMWYGSEGNRRLRMYSITILPGFATRHITYIKGSPIAPGGTKEDGSLFSIKISLGWLLPIWFLVLLRANAIRNRRLDTEERVAANQCLSCGYSTVGNTSGRCPECGSLHGAAKP
jgi:hypothetical protein